MTRRRRCASSVVNEPRTSLRRAFSARVRYPHPIDPAQRRLFSSRAVALAAAVSSVVNEPIDLVRLSLDERIVVRATRHSPP